MEEMYFPKKGNVPKWFTFNSINWQDNQSNIDLNLIMFKFSIYDWNFPSIYSPGTCGDWQWTWTCPWRWWSRSGRTWGSPRWEWCGSFWKEQGEFINSKLQEICSSYLQNISCWGNGNCLLSLSWMMKGRHRPSRRSDNARLNMKMFRPVLMALLVITAMRTIMLFTTRIFEISHWLINGLWLNWLFLALQKWMTYFANTLIV